MPRKTELSLEQLKGDRGLMRALTVPIAQVEAGVEGGEKLVLEESLFSDPGEDYVAVFLGDRPQSIVYIPGY